MSLQLKKFFLLGVILTALFSIGLSQKMQEDTTKNQPFFQAKKFNSRAYVGFEAMPAQILKTKAAMLLGFHLGWIVNYKYVVSAKYHTITTPTDIHQIVAPYYNSPRNLIHHFAGLSFSYILFHNKKFSFQPELAVGWCTAKFEYPDDVKQRNDYAMFIPSVNGTWNASKLIRIGVGVNYRVAIGKKFYSFKSSELNGLSGIVFFRVGNFGK